MEQSTAQRRGLTKVEKSQRRKESKKRHKENYRANKRSREIGEIGLAEEVTEVVSYTGLAHIAKYLRRLFATEKLTTENFMKTHEFAVQRNHLSRCVIDMMCYPGDARDEEIHALLADLSEPRERLYNYIWQLFNIAHRRASAHTSEAITEAAGHMWAIFMYVYLDRKQRLSGAGFLNVKSRLMTPAEQFEFARATLARSDPAIVSAQPVGSYSVSTLWRASTTLIGALYDFPFSDKMMDYVSILCVRHAQLLTATGPKLTRAERAEFYDHPRYCTADVGVPFLVDEGLDDDDGAPNSDDDASAMDIDQQPGEGEEDASSENDAGRDRSVPVLLNDAYLRDSQPLFGNQLRRMWRVSFLREKALQPNSAFRSLDTATTAAGDLERLMTFVRDVAKHDKLRRFVAEEVKKDLLRTQLYHGETQRFIHNQPRQHPEPDNILATTRHQAYRDMPAMLTKMVDVYCNEYAASVPLVEGHAKAIEWEERARPANEAVVVKCLYVTTNTWLVYKDAHKEFLQNRWHFEEMHIGRDEIDDVLRLPAKRPCWVRCMRWNFVINQKEQVVYAGTGIVAAFVAWLRATFKDGSKEAVGAVDNEKGGKLFATVIHPKWRPWFNSLSAEIEKGAKKEAAPADSSNPAVSVL